MKSVKVRDLIHDLRERNEINNLRVSNHYNYMELPVVIEVGGKQYNFEITEGHRKVVLQITDPISF